MGDCGMHKQADNGIIHRNTLHPEPYIPPLLTSLGHPLIKLRGIITLSEIVEKVDKLPSSRDGREFRAIPIKMCKTVGWNDSIGDIFQI